MLVIFHLFCGPLGSGSKICTQDLELATSGSQVVASQRHPSGPRRDVLPLKTPAAGASGVIKYGNGNIPKNGGNYGGFTGKIIDLGIRDFQPAPCLISGV